MAFQVVETGGFGSGHHLGVLLLGGGDEGNIHIGAILFPNSAGEELALIQKIVQDRSLFRVPLRHGLQTAVGQQILEHLAAAVDGPAVGGVVERIGVCMGLVAEIGGNEFRHIVPDQILPNNDDGHTGRAYVFLDAGPDQAVFADVAGTGEEHGGLIRHQNLSLGIGQVMPCGAVDGLVFADINVVCIIGNIQIGAVGNVAEILVGGGGDHLYLTVALGFGNGLFAPGAGFHIAGHAIFHQIHGNHGKLHRAAALNEKNFIVFGNVHQRPQIGLGFCQNILKHLGAVAHLHDAHTAAVVIQHLGGDLLQNRLRHHGRAGRKIVNAIVFHRKDSFQTQNYAMRSFIIRRDPRGNQRIKRKKRAEKSLSLRQNPQENTPFL